MSIINFITLLGGLAIFLFGMDTMGEGLKRSAGGKLKSFLENVTNNPLKAVLLGAGVTAVIQSSSATTVMLVGFVNSGIMKLGQSIGVIMGANIGTTVTAWILSLTSVTGENIFIQLMGASNLAFIAAIIGILLIMASKNPKHRDIGSILLGFTMIMVGMGFMSDSVEPLKESEKFQQVLLLFSNPVLGILVGAGFTAIIQSSSASIGILQALTMSVNIKYATAWPIIMGQNIGTCVTAVLASIGTTKDAKRVACIHLAFNLIGTVIFLLVFYSVQAFLPLPIMDANATPFGIAVANTAFKIFSTIIMFPFMKQLENLSYLIIKRDKTDDEPVLLDERLLSTPTIAISQATKLTHKMAEISKDSLLGALNLVANFDPEIAAKIRKNEGVVDHYEDVIGSYLVKLSRESLSVEDSHAVSNLLHTIGDFERISDHAVNLVDVANEINEKSIVFSESARHEIKILSIAMHEILDNTYTAFLNNDLDFAAKIEPLEQVIDKIRFKLKKRHIARLQQGECTIETGFVFSDFITNCERVADHCSNIAVCLIQVAEDSFDTHEYLRNVKDGTNDSFDALYKEYLNKYSL